MRAMSSAGNNEAHYLLEIREPGDAIVELRKELMYHPDITDRAQHGGSFEECLGIIAMCVDLALDGLYDAEDVCAKLVEILRQRRFFPGGNGPVIPGLLSVEMVEREDSITLQEVDTNVRTVIPEGAIVTSTGQGSKGSPLLDESGSSITPGSSIPPAEDDRRSPGKTGGSSKSSSTLDGASE